MDKETRLLIAGLGTPLIVAVCGWGNSYFETRRLAQEEAFARTKIVIAERETTIAESEATIAGRETLEMSDDFQEYIEYVMAQRGCEP